MCTNRNLHRALQWYPNTHTPSHTHSHSTFICCGMGTIQGNRKHQKRQYLGFGFYLQAKSKLVFLFHSFAHSLRVFHAYGIQNCNRLHQYITNANTMPNAFSLISIFLIQCDLISSENDLMRINSKCDVFQCCEIETELSRSTIFRLFPWNTFFSQTGIQMESGGKRKLYS